MRILVSLLLLGVLSACSVFEEEAPEICPRVQVLSEGRELTTYRSDDRDLTDVVYKVAIEDAFLICDVDEEEVETEVTIQFSARRGPANQDGRAPFGYFLAVLDRSGAILARKEFVVDAPFPGNRRAIGFAEVIENEIPLPEGARSDDFAIAVGLLLTPEQYREKKATGS